MRVFNRILLIGVTITLLFLGCSNSSQTSDQRILPKHYLLDQKHFLGEYDGGHIYIDPDDDPRLKKGYVVGVYVATEFPSLLIKNPENGKMALWYPGDDQKAKNLLFESYEEDSAMSNIWDVASGKEEPEATMKGKDGKVWARVDIQASKKQRSVYYTNPNSVDTCATDGEEYECALSIELSKRRFLVYYKEEGPKVKVQLTDYMWTPLGETPYHSPEEGFEKDLWKYLIKHYPLKTE